MRDHAPDLAPDQPADCQPARSLLEAALARVRSALPHGGEPRPGQLAMANAAADAIATERHLIVQAGTGTGKSLAYLLACITSGKKAVVSTTTKGLQDQLARKDLPLIQQVLGAKVTFSVLKGRSNYLCRQRALELQDSGEQLTLTGWNDTDPGTPLPGELHRLLTWAEASPTGDRAELDFEPSPAAWAQLSTGSRECPGAARCPSGDSCFAEAAKERAVAANIVVVNSHLYGAHLASDSGVLCDHDVVVFDEAHDLEDVLTNSLAAEVGPTRLRSFAVTCQPLIASKRGRSRLRGTSPARVGSRNQAPDALTALLEAASQLEKALIPLIGKRVVGQAALEEARVSATSTLALLDDISGVLAVVDERLGAVVDALAPEPARSDKLATVRARALLAGGYLQEDLRAVSYPSERSVEWVEAQGSSCVLRVAPVEIASVLSERLWGDVTGVMTSATIPSTLLDRLGLDPAVTTSLDVGSPFPYDELALLYCAAHLPDPRDPSAEAAYHDELASLINAAGGRTLALFTSRRAMQQAAVAMSERLAFRILVQSDLPNPALVRAFTKDETSCLFATMGFWQGVDVPGASLSLVVIDRIPFPRPDEPVTQARREAAGRAGFTSVDLPRARVLLAQGAGRLIRNATDRGVVAVLDSRLVTARYGRTLLAGLPPMRLTTRQSDAVDLLSSIRSARPRSSGDPGPTTVST